MTTPTGFLAGNLEDVHMTDSKDTKDTDWDDTDEPIEEFPESGNIMQFSDFIEPKEQHVQKQRITQLRRRAEERQDWKRIIGEYGLDIDDALEEA